VRKGRREYTDTYSTTKEKRGMITRMILEEKVQKNSFEEGGVVTGT